VDATLPLVTPTRALGRVRCVAGPRLCAIHNLRSITRILLDGREVGEKTLALAESVSGRLAGRCDARRGVTRFPSPTPRLRPRPCPSA
jgi:hypothetical protein